jgi:hypothetical protein
LKQLYQGNNDPHETLYAIYHNENYPSTLPYDPVTSKGYKNEKWPQGLLGPESPAAVCRIGIMKSINGGRSWENKGIFIEDLDPRLILKPHNTSNTFAGGVGDPSAVASGKYLYLFYGEYGYPGVYNETSYDRKTEWEGQHKCCRIALSDLDDPAGKAEDGMVGLHNTQWCWKMIRSWYLSMGEETSSPEGFHWGPSVSWNTYLDCGYVWGMLQDHHGKAVKCLSHSIRILILTICHTRRNGLNLSFCLTCPAIPCGIRRSSL